MDLVKAYAEGKLGTLEFVSQLKTQARVSARVAVYVGYEGLSTVLRREP